MTAALRASPGTPADARWHPADPDRWLVGPMAARNSRYRLLCLPHAGGAPSGFRSWSPLLPSGVQLLVAQLPGRESRYAEPAHEEVAPVVDGIVRALAGLEPLPLVIFGHSMGALIAYELAHALPQRGGVAPSLLAVSGHGSPQNPEHYADLLDADTETFIEQVASRYGGIPAPILADRTLLQFFLPLLRADFRLVARYRARPREPLACPLLVLGGDRDPHVPPSALEEWRHCTRAHCEVRCFPGGHFYLADQPHAVLDALFAALPPDPRR